MQILAVLLPLAISFLRTPLERHNIFLSSPISPALSTPNPYTATTPSPARVLLVTAHPDDETLFFAPTLTALLARPEVVEVYALCLSTGAAGGVGDVRSAEMKEAWEVLGVREGRGWVIDHKKLQDNMSANWDAQVIADVVEPYVVREGITTILTFDEGGVSGHPNHASIPRGLIRLLSSTALPHSEPPPRLYTLISRPLLTKYTGPLSAVLAKTDIALQVFHAHFFPSPSASPIATGEDTGIPVFVSGVGEYLLALRAMRAHWSQLVWFRWLYVSASRYMWVNEWVQVQVGKEGQ